jgi:hypothetical protein
MHYETARKQRQLNAYYAKRAHYVAQRKEEEAREDGENFKTVWAAFVQSIKENTTPKI